MKLWKISLIDCFSGSEVYVEAPGISEALYKVKVQFKEEQIKSIELISPNPVLR